MQADGNFTLKEVLSQKCSDFVWVFKIYVYTMQNAYFTAGSTGAQIGIQ